MRTLLAIIIFGLAASAWAGGVLREDTATSITIGPMVDATDGATAETGLTVTVYVSANGGAFGLRSHSVAAAHDRAGFYRLGLNSTDTSQSGILKIEAFPSGALPYFETFQVMPTQVYDSLYGSDRLQVHAAEISNDLITAAAVAADTIGASEIAADAIGASEIATAAITAAEMDLTGSEFTAIPWNAAWDAEAQSEATDALNAYDGPTNAEFEARTIAAASYATATALDAVDNYVDTEIGAIISAIAALTDVTAQEVWEYATRTLTSGAAPSAASIADAVWDEAQSGHTTAGTFGNYLDAAISGVGGATGSGADSTTITLTVSSVALPDASVWITLDSAGTTVVAGTLTTDDDGQAIFLLDAGSTYYLWVKKAGYADIRGTSFVASASGNAFTTTAASGGSGGIGGWQ